LETIAQFIFQKGEHGQFQCRSSEQKQCGGNLFDPKESATLVANEPINTAVNQRLVQIQPQQMKIKTRPGKYLFFSVYFYGKFAITINLVLLI